MPATAPSRPRQISTNVDGRLHYATWAVEPSSLQIQRYYPLKARKMRVSGGAVLACRVKPDKHLKDCYVLHEFPKGFDFGQAVLAASSGFLVNPPREGGMVLENAWVSIQIAIEAR